MHMTGMGAFSPPSETPAPPKLDGRRQRSERTRARLVEACRVLMRGGVYRPTSTEIAATSDTSVRTIFLYYATMAELYVVALEDNALAAKIADPVRLLSNVDLARAIVLGDVPT